MVASAVREAAEQLDQLKPGWQARVNIDNLDLGDPDACILYWVYGSYTWGISDIDNHFGEGNHHVFDDNHYRDDWIAVIEGSTVPVRAESTLEEQVKELESQLEKKRAELAERDTTPGQRAMQGFYKATDGCGTPWQDLTETSRACWEAAAQAVLDGEKKS